MEVDSATDFAPELPEKEKKPESGQGSRSNYQFTGNTKKNTSQDTTGMESAKFKQIITRTNNLASSTNTLQGKKKKKKRSQVKHTVNKQCKKPTSFKQCQH